MTQASNLANFANNLNSSGQLDPNSLSSVVPIAKGGTNASTASDARTNLNVPTRTGGDASGDWNINITGNAATATTATTATTAVNATNANNATTVTNGVYTTNFTGLNQTLSTNGFQKLPGGLVIAWCTGPAVSGESGVTVTFPYTFTNVYNIQVTTYVPSGPAPDADFQVTSVPSGSSVSLYLNYQAAQGGTAYPFVLIIGK